MFLYVCIHLSIYLSIHLSIHLPMDGWSRPTPRTHISSISSPQHVRTCSCRSNYMQACTFRVILNSPVEDNKIQALCKHSQEIEFNCLGSKIQGAKTIEFEPWILYIHKQHKQISERTQSCVYICVCIYSCTCKPPLYTRVCVSVFHVYTIHACLRAAHPWLP